MCGVVGVLSIEKFPEKMKRAHFFREALFCGSLRGYDSTGMFYVDEENDIGVIKNTMIGSEFVQQKSVERVLDNMQHMRAVIGHNRFKTSGQVTKRDAHPHEHKNITLVHNGGIENSYNFVDVPRDHKNDPDVDTFRLTKAFGEKGAMEVLPHTRGSYAIVWWDSREHALFMARNEGRPLHFVWGEKYQSLYLASEWEMLSWLVKRNGLETEGKIVSLAPFVQYKFTFEEKRLELERTQYALKEEPRHYPGLPDIHRGRPPETNVGLPYLDDEDLEMNWPPKRDPITGMVVKKKAPDDPLAAGREPTIISIESKRPSEKQLNRISKALKELGTVYDAATWAVPHVWYEYKKSKGEKGVGEFAWIKDGKTQIHIHGMLQSDWAKILNAALLTPVRVVDITHNNTILVGEVDWPRLAEAHDYVIKSIPADDNIVKFIPHNPTGMFITKKEFYELTETGCAYCKQMITLADAEDLEFVDDMPVCGDCAEQLHPANIKAKANG